MCVTLDSGSALQWIVTSLQYFSDGQEQLASGDIESTHLILYWETGFYFCRNLRKWPCPLYLFGL